MCGQFVGYIRRINYKAVNLNKLRNRLALNRSHFDAACCDKLNKEFVTAKGKGQEQILLVIRKILFYFYSGFTSVNKQSGGKSLQYLASRK